VVVFGGLVPAVHAGVASAAAEKAVHVPFLVHAVWLIAALPLAAFVLLVLVGRRLGEPLAGLVATAAMGGSFVASVLTFIGLRQMHGEERHVVQKIFTWLPVGGFKVDLAFLADPLSLTMCLFVTGVATLIFLYAVGYMHGDPNFSKFFIYLAFFSSSMLILILGSNMLVTFLGWEGVGAASYFLIGFWFQDEANSSAAKKAFITNRVGDFGFMVAMFFAFRAFGSLDYSVMFSHAGTVAVTTLTAISVLTLLGAAGKSAQVPLFLWLPDAMAGPTPVSALMHAATMVTAGVYLLVRMNPILAASSPWVLTLIAWVGAATALIAATIAISQRDIKKVLAYSTVSQLGYMVLAVGSGAYVAAIFHMVTHAFFKALLFLGAGSVIHGMDNEQDMDYMGGLRKFFPITSVTFIIGWLAIAGVPPFAGMWSKGEILTAAFHKSPALWAVGFATAILTAYYMTREVVLVFLGERRWTEAPHGEHAHDNHHAHATHDAEGNLLPEGPGAPHHVESGAPVHPHESPIYMTLPLMVLAAAASVGGLLNLPFANRTKLLEHWLEPSVPGEVHFSIRGVEQFGLEAAAVIVGIIAIAAGFAVYLKRSRAEQKKLEPEILYDGWYYDRTVTNFMGGPGRVAFDWITNWFDRVIIDGAVNGFGWLARTVGTGARRTQTGYVRNYALTVTVGVVALVGFVLLRATF
jgi:NADH-quinone oxidoreductase subunit L